MALHMFRKAGLGWTGMLGRAASDTVWVHGRTWKHGPGLFGYIGWSKREIRTGPGPREHRPHCPVSVRGRCHAGAEPNRFFLPRAVAAPSVGLTTMARGFLNVMSALVVARALGTIGGGAQTRRSRSYFGLVGLSRDGFICLAGGGERKEHRRSSVAKRGELLSPQFQSRSPRVPREPITAPHIPNFQPVPVTRPSSSQPDPTAAGTSTCTKTPPGC